MSERLRNVLSAVILLVGVTAIAVLILTAPSQADRVETLGKQIKCPVCQGESIANSPSEMARDMMALVTQRVGEGVSDQEIVDELLASYTGAVLLDPPASGATLLLWILPAVAVVGGGVVIWWWQRHPGDTTSQTQEPATRSGSRVLAGGLLLAGSLALIVIVAGFFLQDRAGPNSGVADLQVDNLDSVSNETMEAVIASNLQHPQINGMRLALAERYFETGDYQAAFPHYLAVAESGNATETESVSSLIRLGWMAWDGNQAADAALGMFDRALEIAPDSTTALYLKGQVLWCGALDPDAAAELFAGVLESADLPDDTRDLVEADLAAASEGAACT